MSTEINKSIFFGDADDKYLDRIAQIVELRSYRLYFRLVGLDHIEEIERAIKFLCRPVFGLDLKGLHKNVNKDTDCCKFFIRVSGSEKDVTLLSENLKNMFNFYNGSLKCQFL